MSNNKTKETIVSKALHYFNVDGWNCAESVYMAIFREYYRIDVTPKTVTAYGGGIARTGSFCGAINVAIMGLSQKYGRENSRQPFIRTQRPTLEFLNQLIDQYGTLNCNRLKQSQLAKQKAKTTKEENLCTPLIRKVIETFLTMVENNKQNL
ncbi:MAG: C-GCAxxG-C-C family protein [Candidatus Bathyarchaeota archaeon]|nr:C-GCAxxG-C-C family protein [Candidatus Bathyarchaeota archaeon]